MKRTHVLRTFAATIAISALAAATSSATTYTDATGEIISSANIDIASVEVVNNATDLFFTLHLNGSIANPTDWGNYTVGINSTAGGDTTGNGWVRPISMSAGMDYWIGSWVNGGGGSQLWKYSGTWSQQNSGSVTIGSQSVTFSESLAAHGLNPGDSFTFDVYSTGTGGGDGAVDALSNPAQSIANWGDAYNSGANVSTFTVSTVPEPASLALAGLASLVVGSRLLRRRA